MKTFFQIFFSALMIYSTQAVAQSKANCISVLAIQDMHLKKYDTHLVFSYHISGCNTTTGLTFVSSPNMIHYEEEITGNTYISIPIYPDPSHCEQSGSGPGWEPSGNEYIYTITCGVTNEHGSDFDGCDIVLDGDD